VKFINLPLSREYERKRIFGGGFVPHQPIQAPPSLVRTISLYYDRINNDHPAGSAFEIFQEFVHTMRVCCTVRFKAKIK
jgi:hypothetical protein